MTILPLFHCSSVVKSIREHLDLITSAVITIARSIFFIGKLSNKVPKKAVNFSFVMINTAGVLYLDWQVNALKKGAKDLIFALKARVVPLVILTTLRMVQLVNDVFMLFAGLAAASYLFAERHGVADKIYAIMRPWGITFLVISIILDFSNYQLYHSTKSELQEALVDKRCKYLLHALCRREASAQDLALAAKIHASMDRYTLETLLTTQNKSSHSLLRQVVANIATQQESERNNLSLRLYGYGALFLCKAYPHTLVHATTLLTTSLLYTLHHCYKKWFEADQRRQITFGK